MAAAAPVVGDREVLTPIASAADLATVRGLPRAVVFLHARWSGPSVRSRKHVRELVERLRADGFAVPAFEADVSEDGEVTEAVLAWAIAEGREADPGLLHGYGALIWAIGGRIVQHVPAAFQHPVADLAAATRAAFADT